MVVVTGNSNIFRGWFLLKFPHHAVLKCVCWSVHASVCLREVVCEKMNVLAFLSPFIQQYRERKSKRTLWVHFVQKILSGDIMNEWEKRREIFAGHELYIVAVYETHTKRIYNTNSMMIPQKICVYSVYYLFCWKVDKMVGSGRETSSCGS